MTIAGPVAGAVAETLPGQATAGGSATRFTGGLFDALGALGLLQLPQVATAITTVSSQIPRLRIPS